jgi:undecaprenyl-diphosphatase
LIGVDQRLERAIASHRIGVFDPVAVALSWLGDYGVIWLALALVLAFYWRRPSVVIWVGAADLIGYLAATGLQDVTNRQRPPRAFPEIVTLVSLPHSSSFPSGHTTTSFACAVFLASVLRSRRVWALLITLAALIGLSRIYAGVHYPLDIVGGAALGTVIGLAFIALARTVERRNSPLRTEAL